jgi:DMSO/TMAO reductase YedYZ molybdopterin-dependent catalytic subunit
MPTQPHRLVTVTDSPFNAETPLSALSQEVTPAELFFVRCNFDTPVLDAAAWRLRVDGLVRREATLALADLKALPYREVTATVECAGNGRRLMDPIPGGTAWQLGAASTGVFGGVSLAGVLGACGVGDAAVEVACHGADAGAVSEGEAAGGGPVQFVRSVPLSKALEPDTLLAWSLNGEPLAPEHGYPLRVLVPGWYGMASVKWLTRLTVLDEPFRGHFQTDRYVYRGHPDYAADTPVTRMHVRSVIAEPAAGDMVGAGDMVATGGAVAVGAAVTVRGAAWSGFAAIRSVEVSTDGGASWSPAELTPAASPWGACVWSYEWRPARPGEHVLAVRATDAAGGTQPLGPVWNELGYGNNVVHRVRVRVE